MAAAKPSLSMRAWLALTWCAHPVWKRQIQKRVETGKEDPVRWREKLGEASAQRQTGTLIWLHAVGLGEVLALRGLVNKLNGLRPDWSFIITSGTRASADVLAGNMPANCIHQFLPVDTPQASRRFLDHWRPELAIWAEQELWPGLVYQSDARNIPLALVNARMNAVSFKKRKPVRTLYADALSRFAVVSAQDDETAQNLAALGADKPRTDGSLKPIAPPLAADGIESVLQQADGRFIWLVASSHPADEAIAIAAHKTVLTQHSDALLILVPRDISRGAQLVNSAKSAELTVGLRSEGEPTDREVYVADTFGELGVWFRAAQVACIGGSFGDTEGHNPWEAVALGTRVLHGPRIANFAADYAALAAHGAATLVTTSKELGTALMAQDHRRYADAATRLMNQRNEKLDALCADIVDLGPKS